MGVTIGILFVFGFFVTFRTKSYVNIFTVIEFQFISFVTHSVVSLPDMEIVSVFKSDIISILISKLRAKMWR